MIYFCSTHKHEFCLLLVIKSINSPDFLKNSSFSSTGIIKINQGSVDNSFASGNLIKYGKLRLFSTCRHVIKTQNNLIRKIKLIQLYKGPVLKPEGPIYL